MASIRDFKYKIIKNFFTQEELNILQPYCYKKLLVYNKRYDQHTLTPYWSNDELMDTILETKEPLICKHSGLEVNKTYAYWRYYVHGGFLKDHLDRPSCEISVSACIKKYDNWPLIMQGKKYELEEGDGVIYLGCELPHSRPGIYKGQGMAQVFLHYVDKNGPFTHHINDNYFKNSNYQSTESPADTKIYKDKRKKYAERN